MAASAGAKIGLPEVLLGLLPGAGGTQRLPRLSGLPFSLDVILSGRQVPAKEALEKGAVDRVMSGEQRDVALAAAQDVLAGKLSTRKTKNLTADYDAKAIEETMTYPGEIRVTVLRETKVVEYAK